MDIIIKPSSLVDSENIHTLAQRKIFNVLLEHTRQHIESNEKMFTMSLKTLRAKAGESLFQSNAHLFEQVKSMVNMRPIEINILGKDKKYKKSIVANFFSEATYDNEKETISWEFSTTIYNMLKNLNTPTLEELGNYVRLPLAIQAQFRSKHAMAFWEFFKSRFDEKRGYSESPFITLEELNKIFGCNYADWFQLNAKVVQKAIQEIHTYEPTFFITLHTQKIRYKVSAVKFVIQHRNYEQPILPNERKKKQQEQLFKSERTPAIDPKHNAVVERYLATLSSEQQARIMEEAEKSIPEFMAFPTTEQDQTAYQLLLRLTRNTIVESLINADIKDKI